MYAQEEERARIARDLHDEVCPRIIALSVDLGELRRRLPIDDENVDRALEEMSRQWGALGSDVQALSHRLHSSKVELLGLGEAAASFCRELSTQQGLTIECRHDGVPKHLPPNMALGLLRVLQEALMNAVKHSGVRSFEVALWGADGFVYLNVIDRGIGFDPEDVIKKNGLGLASMRERVGLIGGQLLVQSRPTHGTTISVTVRIATAVAQSHLRGAVVT
jgi:signal transduction histidine kinase